MRRGWTVGLSVMLLLVASPRLQAQTDPRLVSALRAAQEGRGDSARAAVRRLLDSTAATDTLYPQVLYTLAEVAADVGDMRHNLQRVIVEHGLSPWAPHALLRLAELEYAAGNLPAALRDLGRLRQDFPDSPLLSRAARWGARIDFEAMDPSGACGWLRFGLPRSAPGSDERRQLALFAPRCGPETLALLDTLQRDTVPVQVATTAAPAPPVAIRDSVPPRPDSTPVPPDTTRMRRDTVPPVRADTVRAAAPPGPRRLRPPLQPRPRHGQDLRCRSWRRLRGARRRPPSGVLADWVPRERSSRRAGSSRSGPARTPPGPPHPPPSAGSGPTSPVRSWCRCHE